LKSDAANQRKNVEEAQAKMREIREKESVVDPKPEEDPEVYTGTQNRGYLKAKLEYLVSKKLSEDSERRLATETTRITMAVIPAKIWEKAEPAIYPSKPNVPLIMSIGAGAGVFLGFVFSGIFLLCVCLRRKPPVAS